MKGKSGIVYFIQQDEDDYFKIGKTRVNTRKRLIGNQVGNPKKLRIYGKIKSADVDADELRLHHKYNLRKQNGEWFNLTPYEVEYEIDSCGENGQVLIRTPKPSGFIKKFYEFILKNKMVTFMYIYLQVLSFNSTHVAAQKYLSYMPSSFHIQAALTIVFCSQPLYWFLFDAIHKASKKRF